jgi:dynein heavy chain
LIGETIYGGRVTDDYDRRIVSTYLEEYFGDFLFDDHFPFSFFANENVTYNVPAVELREEYINAIEALPLNNSPDVFGLHPDSEIGYLAGTVKEMWAQLISLQPHGGEGVGNMSREEFLDGMANDIQKIIPDDFDVHHVKRSMDVPSPTQVVLLQELDRWNNLIRVMKSTLKDLRRALKGEIGMSQKLDELATSLMNGFIPSSWRSLAPQTEKNLSNWLKHFQRRYEQYNNWIEKGEPVVMWLSGLQIPEAYLTALVQATCRANGWPLDKSTLYTEVTNHVDPKGIKEPPVSGCYIHGLYLQGATWDTESGSLKRVENGGKLLQELPVMKVIPIEAHRLKLVNTFRTPVYTTELRRNAAGVGWVFDADLYTTTHASHWTLQGVALLLNDSL